MDSVRSVREVMVCRRCIKQAAGRLVKDPDFEWEKPG